MTAAMTTRATEKIGLGRVLVATDLSLDGDRAVRRAAALPLRPKARLLVIYAVPPGVDRAAETVIRGAAETELDVAKTKLRNWLAARKRADVLVAAKVVRGRPAEAIAAQARVIDAELICVGRRGQSRLQRALLGSTAKQVVRVAGRPVLVVSRSPSAPYREVLLGHDLTPMSNRAARLARAVTPLSGQLTAVHAYEDPLQGIPATMAPPPGATRRETVEQILQARSAQLEAALEPLVVAGKKWRLTVERGDPRTVLLTQARRRRADLIAMGSAGLRGLGKLLIGSVAESVLERAPCDVLIVRAGS